MVAFHDLYVRLAYDDEHAAAQWLIRVPGRTIYWLDQGGGTVMIAPSGFGVESLRPLGERRYEAFDIEGHRWHFSQQLASTEPCPDGR